MHIKTESMVDVQRLIKMSQGEVFIWHIERHLSKQDEGSCEISKGEVGCKICGKTTQQIFDKERESYYAFMTEKYGEEGKGE